MDALALANKRRFAGSAFRRRISTLPMDEACELLAELLLDRDLPEHIEAMRLRRYLGCIRHFGETKVHRVVYSASIYRFDPTLRDLNSRERRNLALALRRRTKH